MRGPVLATLAAAALSFGVTGCSATGGSATGTAAYWLIKVHGNYANVYAYPPSLTPWRSNDPTHAVYLGQTRADSQSHLAQAAERMGIPISHIKYV
jgi:hypothetical protein